jgi:putative Mg2+ transporter-C (MgtC) family protein
MASSLLILVAVYKRDWFSFVVHENVNVDPTHMAQGGIMTGIGLFGAGVIMKEWASIRGLTTAASIWITSAIRHPVRGGPLQHVDDRDNSDPDYHDPVSFFG